MKKTEEFRVSLILTKIGFEQIRKKIHFLFLQTNQKKSKGERIHKIQQEFSQHESCLLSKHDFVFGGGGGGGGFIAEIRQPKPLRKTDYMRGCRFLFSVCFVLFFGKGSNSNFL